MGKREHSHGLLAVLLLLLAWLSVPALGSAGPAPHAQLALIAHPKLKLRKVQLAEVRNLFLRRSETLHGQQSVPLNYPSGSAHRVLFDQQVLAMNPEQVGRYWVDVRIRGGGRPPRTVPTPELMLRVVAELQAAVGYVPVELARDPRVKVLELEPNVLRAQ
jgi:hypothetical protein